MKYYRVKTSANESVILDQEDYNKLLQGMDSGSFVRLKKAVLNPSFIVGIFPISQKEALEDELPPRKVEGYIDEKTGKYIVTKDERPVVTDLRDEFKD